MWSTSPQGSRPGMSPNKSSRPGSARVSKPSNLNSTSHYKAAVAAAASQLKHANSFPLPGSTGFNGFYNGGPGQSNGTSGSMNGGREGSLRSEKSQESMNSDDLQNLSSLMGFDAGGNLEKDDDIWGSLL